MLEMVWDIIDQKEHVNYSLRILCIHNRLGKKRQKISIGEDVGQSKPYMLRVTVSK